MRIFIGTHDIAAVVTNLAEGFRNLGHHVETAVWKKHQFYPHFEYDRIIKNVRDKISFNIGDDDSVSINNIPPDFQEWMLSFDLYVFIAGQSFFQGNMDFPILKEHGKKITSFFCGSEVRHWAAAEPMWKEWGGHLPPYMRKESLKNTSNSIVQPIKQGVYWDTFANKMHNVQMAERYASTIFSVPEQSGLQSRPYQSFGLPINLDDFTFNIPARDVPVVIHTPSNKGFKRTDLVLECVERLKAEGINFDFKMLHKVPHKEILEALTDADVLVDEMSHFPAVLAYEAMASGCAVLAGNHDGVVPLPDPKERPVMHIEPSNLYEQMKRVLTDKDLRIKLAEAGAVYVKQYGDRNMVAKRMLDDVERSERGDFDYYPHYFFNDLTIPDGEILPDYLQYMRLEILMEHGIPLKSDLTRLILAGLLPSSAFKYLDTIESKQWKQPMKETAKWVWTADRENLFPIKNNSTKISIPLRTSSDTYNPFFITGAGRSGTSLVRRILIANTDIHIPPETYVLGNCVLNFEMFQFMPWEELVDIVLDLFENHNEFYTFEISLTKLRKQLKLTEKSKRSLAVILDGFFKFHAAKHSPKAKIWGDKTPMNAFSLPELLSLYPNGKFVHMLRDGYDFVFSCLQAKRYDNVPEAANRWVRSVNICRRFETLFPENFMTVKYEELVSNPSEKMKEICDFIDLEFTEDMLDSENMAEKMADTLKSGSHEQLKMSISARNVGKGRKNLTQEQKFTATKIIFPELIRYGYPIEDELVFNLRIQENNSSS